MTRVIAALFSLVCAWSLAGPAAAWSEAAHRTIAEVAYARLTPQAKVAVDALIEEGRFPVAGALAAEPSCPVATLADAAVFMDCVDGIRRYNDFRRLHYENAPLCGAVDKASYCRNGECLSEAVKRAAAVLADPLALPLDKLFALQQLSSFIGDLHQPYQMIDNRDDRGGAGEARGECHAVLLFEVMFLRTALGRG